MSHTLCNTYKEAAQVYIDILDDNGAGDTLKQTAREGLLRLAGYVDEAHDALFNKRIFNNAND